MQLVTSRQCLSDTRSSSSLPADSLLRGPQASRTLTWALQVTGFTSLSPSLTLAAAAGASSLRRPGEPPASLGTGWEVWQQGLLVPTLHWPPLLEHQLPQHSRNRPCSTQLCALLLPLPEAEALVTRGSWSPPRPPEPGSHPSGAAWKSSGSMPAPATSPATNTVLHA